MSKDNYWIEYDEPQDGFYSWEKSTTDPTKNWERNENQKQFEIQQKQEKDEILINGIKFFFTSFEWKRLSILFINIFINF